MSCGPTDRELGFITRKYLIETGLFECKIVSLREPSHNDSSRFLTETYYVLAKDVYDAQRLFETKFTERAGTLNGAEAHWTKIPISGLQPYPYPTYQ